MAALNFLRRSGVTVNAVADKLRLSPVARITEPMRQFIREHHAALLAELLIERPAANNHLGGTVAPVASSEPTRTASSISRAGPPIGYMVGKLMTHSEALTVARLRWPDAKILEAQ